MIIYNSENTKMHDILCLYMYHYICINGRNHCNQGFTSLKRQQHLIKKARPVLLIIKNKKNATYQQFVLCAFCIFLHQNSYIFCLEQNRFSNPPPSIRVVDGGFITRLYLYPPINNDLP